MSNVREILKAKDGNIWSVTPHTTVKDTIKLMSEKNVGAVLVLEGKKIMGIFSERDFIRNAAKTDLCATQEALVKEMMTTRILFVNPAQTTEECMSLMTTKRIRHLPVIDNEELLGFISIGDVVKKIIDDQKFSISQLEQYVTGGIY